MMDNYNENLAGSLNYLYNTVSPRVAIAINHAKKTLPNAGAVLKQKLANGAQTVANNAMNVHIDSGNYNSKVSKINSIINGANHINDFVSGSLDPNPNAHDIVRRGSFALGSTAQKLANKLKK